MVPNSVLPFLNCINDFQMNLFVITFLRVVELRGNWVKREKEEPTAFERDQQGDSFEVD